MSARQRTRSHANANAFTRGGQRVHRRRQTRSHEEANAFTGGGKRVHTRRQTRSHERANTFTRGGKRVHTRRRRQTRLRERGSERISAGQRTIRAHDLFFPVHKNTIQYSTSELSATMGLKNNASETTALA